MTDESVCLTLIVPRQLRDELFDYLSEQSDLVPGFTASDAAGYGAEVTGLIQPTRNSSDSAARAADGQRGLLPSERGGEIVAITAGSYNDRRIP